jgi:hypothetical protein
LYASGQTAPLTNQPPLFEQKGAIPEIKLTRCADTPVIWPYSGEIWPITDENNQNKPPKPSYAT